MPIHSARATRASSSARTPPPRNTFCDAHAPRLSPKTQISAPAGARPRSSSSTRAVRARRDRHLERHQQRAPVVVLHRHRRDVAAGEALLRRQRDRVDVAAERGRADDDAAAVEAAEPLELVHREPRPVGHLRRGVHAHEHADRVVRAARRSRCRRSASPRSRRRAPRRSRACARPGTPPAAGGAGAAAARAAASRRPRRRRRRRGRSASAAARAARPRARARPRRSARRSRASRADCPASATAACGLSGSSVRIDAAPAPTSSRRAATSPPSSSRARRMTSSSVAVPASPPSPMLAALSASCALRGRRISVGAKESASARRGGQRRGVTPLHAARPPRPRAAPRSRRA